MNGAALPTRRDEAWRYADLDAVSRVWPVAAPEQIVVPGGESKTLHLIQDAPEGSTIVRQFAIRIEAGGRLDVHLLNTGGAYGRVSLDVTLGEGAHFELGGAILGNDDQTLEIVTDIVHAEPGATSNQIVRTILGGKATGSFLGKIAVARDAQKTDAAQSVKAMLLDRTATANAKPELEIFADDVKCAHGATVGELDQAALFYLQSRGLPEGQARLLLLQAFVAGVFDGAGNRNELTAAALAKLEAMT